MLVTMPATMNPLLVLLTTLFTAQIFIAMPDGQGGYAVTPQPLAWASPGRSLGVKFDSNGDLLIANAPLGLLQLASPGDTQHQRLLLLTGRVSDESLLSAGYPIEFANSLDVAEDGTIYFTSSTDVVPYRWVHAQQACLVSRGGAALFLAHS
jgi:hypothetical protein